MSRSTRKFKELNNGNPFPFKYDRTHDVSVLVVYQLNKNNKISSLFNYNTGNAITLPVAKSDGILPPYWYLYRSPSAIEQMQYRDFFEERNNARMPSYHWLDLSYSNSKLKKKGRIRTWTLSIYNVYNRLNPYFIYEKNGKLKQYAFFPIIPSLAYSLEF